MEYSVPEEVKTHPTWVRLNNELAWYERASKCNQHGYKTFKTTQIFLAASIPIVALASGATWSRWVVAILGACIAILEGLQQLFQSHALWIEYRSTAERLEQEKHLFLALSGPYRGLAIEKALALLAEQVEDHISAERRKWSEAVRSSKREE